MSLPTLDQEEIISYLSDRTLISDLVLSSTVLLVYDWILMFPDELEFVWSVKLSPLNALYLVQRYMPFIDTIALLYPVLFTTTLEKKADTCRTLYNASGYMYFVGIILTEVVLTLRTWALWGKDIKLTIGLPLFFLCCWIPNIYVFDKFMRSHIFISLPLQKNIGCVILGGERIFFLCWVLLMLYDAGILLLMLIPGFKFFRTGSWSNLTTVIYRDGIAYYLYLFAFSVANVIIILLLPHDLQNLYSAYQRVMHSLLTSRVILHLRSESRKLHSPTNTNGIHFINGELPVVLQETSTSRSADLV